MSVLAVPHHHRLPAPGLVHGSYPERVSADRLARALAAGSARVAGLVPARWQLRHYRAFARRVDQRQQALRDLPQAAFAARVRELRAGLSRHGLGEALMEEAFTLTAEAAARTLGHRPFETQCIAARIMLDGRLAEMATGEGKTLAAALAAAVGALGGMPVHVLTVNDYLVRRDADTLRPLFAMLDLSVGSVTGSADVAARRQAYACDVTYCTARELVFDYLRDRTTRGPARSDLEERVARLGKADGGADALLRGLCMAVVDEADSILIDEARIPLILSAPRVQADQAALHAQAFAMASGLREGDDYVVDAAARTVRLTPAAMAALASAPAGPSAWCNRLHREEAVCTALAALRLYERDRDYLVQDGKVVIIDGATGRLAPGRVWSRGLHQMMEQKEGCEPSPAQVTAAQITYQRFFGRYLRLGGMSGTLREARGELAAVYALPVVRVPLRRPDRRRVLPTRLFASESARRAAVTARAAGLRAEGRPVLIGTGSVAESERLSASLAAAGIDHQVLNARHDADEAARVARAGEAGVVTVATNMAGRGTDIPLGAGVAARGGLHVINCQRNPSARLDRQLVGRAARQGDPGSAETWLVAASTLQRWVATSAGARGWRGPAALVDLAVGIAHWRSERQARAERRHLLERDLRLARSLAGLGDAE